MTRSTERIWLEDPDAAETEHGRTWCDHNAWEGEPGCQPVEYVRADLCRPAVRDREAAIERMAEAISEAHRLHGRSFVFMASAALAALEGDAQ